MKEPCITACTVLAVFVFAIPAISCGNKNEADRNLSGGNWAEKYSVIAHSGGQIEGHNYTNSLEAWNESYARGVRIFDADVNITGDGFFVLRHEWGDDMGLPDEFNGRQLSLEEFLANKPFGKFTPMTLSDMVAFMTEHEDAFVATDCKTSYEKMYAHLAETARNMTGDEGRSILSRIIVSFYSEEQYYAVTGLNLPYENFAIRQYPNFIHDYSELSEFCRTAGIDAVMLWTSPDFLIRRCPLGFLRRYDGTVFGAVVDSEREFEFLRKLGIKGVVSNTLGEN